MIFRPTVDGKWEFSGMVEGRVEYFGLKWRERGGFWAELR